MFILMTVMHSMNHFKKLTISCPMDQKILHRVEVLGSFSYCRVLHTIRCLSVTKGNIWHQKYQ